MSAHEANNFITIRPIIGYCNHSDWPGTVPLIKTAKPLDDVPHPIFTPAYKVSIQKKFHRFYFNEDGNWTWTLTNRYGNLMLGSYVMKLPDIPIYFLIARVEKKSS
jgi:hypothetical protein